LVKALIARGSGRLDVNFVQLIVKQSFEMLGLIAVLLQVRRRHQHLEELRMLPFLIQPEQAVGKPLSGGFQ
jgi:hypothetical protein